TRTNNAGATRKTAKLSSFRNQLILRTCTNPLLPPLLSANTRGVISAFHDAGYSRLSPIKGVLGFGLAHKTGLYRRWHNAPDRRPLWHARSPIDVGIILQSRFCRIMESAPDAGSQGTIAATVQDRGSIDAEPFIAALKVE